MNHTFFHSRAGRELRDCPRLALLFVVSIALAFAVSSPAAADNLTIKLVPLDQYVKLTDPQLGARLLSPDLQATLQTGARFAGVMRDGRSVLSFSSAEELNKWRPELDDAQYIVATERLPPGSNPEDFVPVKQLVVFLIAGEAPPRESFEPYTLVKIADDGSYVVIAPSGGVTAAVLGRLRDVKGVMYIEPAYPVYLDSRPLKRKVPAEYLADMDFSWPVKHTRANLAWERVVSTPAVVAVLDTGVDYTHHDLAPNMWRNLHEIPGNGVDDDGNGQCDDVHGYKFWPVPPLGVACPDPDPSDAALHGTNIAGIIGARADINGPSPGNEVFSGVAWDISIMPVRILSAAKTVPAGSYVVDDGFKYAVKNGARVINASWGTPNDTVMLRNVMAYAEREGVLVVASAGDDIEDIDTVPYYPASYPHNNIITVTSVESDDSLSIGSNVGAQSVDLAAPGGDQSTTDPGNLYAFGSAAGVSMAVAHVSAAAALVWGHPAYRCASWRDVKRLLLENVRKLSSLSNPKRCVSEGTLDLAFLSSAATCACTCLGEYRPRPRIFWPYKSIGELFVAP